MSVKAMARVWEMDLPANEKIVLLAMADHADHDGGSIKPGIPTLAWKASYSESQTRSIVKTLTERGVLVVTDAPAGKNKVWRIDFDQVPIQQARANGKRGRPKNPSENNTPIIAVGARASNRPSKDKEKESAPPQNGVAIPPTPVATDPPSYLSALPLAAEVVHFKDVAHLWDKAARRWQDERYVYIGRANPAYGLPVSRWHNPFHLDEQPDRAQVIEQYQKHLLANEALLAALPELEGKILVCWCRPKHCHGDVLAHLLSHPDSRPAAPKSLKDRWYDAIKDVFGYEGGLNGETVKMLEGRSGLKGFKAYNLNPPVTDPQELREFAHWYYHYELQPDGTRRYRETPLDWHIAKQSRLKLTSDIAAYRAWKATQTPVETPPAPPVEPPAPADFAVISADGRWLGTYNQLAAQAPAGSDPLAFVTQLQNGGAAS